MPVPVDGWLFLCHPEPARRSDRLLPGLVLSPRLGPGPLPGDVALPGGLLHQAGTVRALVDNVSIAGRPADGRPSRRAGTAVVAGRIGQLVEPAQLESLLRQLDAIAADLPARPVELVRSLLSTRIAAVRRATAPPPSRRQAARLAGERFDPHAQRRLTLPG